MRTMIAAALVAAYSLPAFAGGCDTQNCTEAYRRPLEPAVEWFAERAALRQVIEEQAREIERLKVPKVEITEPSTVQEWPGPGQTIAVDCRSPRVQCRNVVAANPVKRKPCKRGRSRNSAGVCGRWN